MTAQGEVKHTDELPQCALHFEDVDRLRKTVYGANGDGLKTRMAVIEEKVSSILFWQKAAMVGIVGLVIERVAEIFI